MTAAAGVRAPVQNRVSGGFTSVGAAGKRYRGDRTIDGLVVTVDGRPLDARLDLKVFSHNGFEWGYEGSEPTQLALAILAEHLGDAERAKTLADQFMRDAVANFSNEWEMTGADIDALLKPAGG